jgi:kinesin family protein 6/9
MVKTQIETYLRLKPEESDSIEYDIKNNFIDIKIPEDLRKGYVNNLKKSYEFKFTGIFDTDSTQEEVYQNIGQKVIKK